MSVRQAARRRAAGVLGLAMAVLVGCQAAAQRAAPAPGPRALEDPRQITRAPWSREAAGFVREWLVCGAFPNPPRPKEELKTTHPVGAGFDTDWLAALGGEAAARPAEGQTVDRPDGTKAVWARSGGDEDVINFRTLFADQALENVVAYAFTTVRREEAGKALLALGSDDSVKVWLNGQLVHTNVVGRPVTADEDVVPVTLGQGDNALLVKVENVRSGWGFILRVLGEAQAAALETGVLRPRIEPSPEGRPDVLAVCTDAGSGAAIRRDEPVEVAVVAAGGQVVAEAKATRGQTVRMETAAWRDGPYEVRVRLRPAEGPPTYIHLPWYKGDWAKQAAELLEAAEKPRPERAGPTQSRYRLLRDLVLDRYGGDPRGEGAAGGDGWRRIHPMLMEHRELAEGSAVRPHGCLRFAWCDPIDDSPQFARAYLPPGYDAAKKWPMIVNLHGYNPPNPEYLHWWDVVKRHAPLAERHGVIFLEPHGRGNAGYAGLGLADVLRAIQTAKDALSVDEDRVYLMGYSMGGAGTWHVGTRHPELFAAIGPIYGGWDYHVWTDAEEFAALEPRERLRREAGSSFAQAEALLATPVFVNHGDRDDLVDVEQSRYAVRMLQRWGYAVRYWEHPGKGHGALGCEDELARWFLERRRERDPREVRVRAADLKSAGAHWVRVLQREDPLALIHADARVADRGTIRLDTENVLEVRLAPGEALVDPTRPVRVIWNGEDAGAQRFAGGAVTLRAKGYAPAEVRKTPGLEGPLGDVTNTPFAIVAGTASNDPAMDRFCRLRAEAARQWWRTWQHAEPRFFLDTEIGEQDLGRYSLILIGGPEENRVTRRLIERLPLVIAPDAITIGGQTFAARDAAVRMVYPHPLNPERYVSIVAGNSAAGMFLTDRLADHVDFAVADGRVAADTPGEDLGVVAGWFDHNWRYQERYATRGDPAARARAAVRKAPRHLTAAIEAKRLPLSELLETEATGSFTRMMRDLNWQAGPIRLGGRTYASGIGVQVWHEPCTCAYDLSGGGWKRLRATLGIEIERPEALQDRHKDGTRVYFVVRGDGRELYRSPIFRWDSGPVAMDVDVAGVQRLELEVANEARWHNAASSVNWADLRLEK